MICQSRQNFPQSLIEPWREEFHPEGYQQNASGLQRKRIEETRILNEQNGRLEVKNKTMNPNTAKEC
jgi:hypothetical protein